MCIVEGGCVCILSADEVLGSKCIIRRDVCVAQAKESPSLLNYSLFPSALILHYKTWNRSHGTVAAAERHM